MAIVTAGAAGTDFDTLLISDLLLGDPILATATEFVLKDGNWRYEFGGQFTYSGQDISGGTVTSWRELEDGQVTFTASGFSVPVTTFIQWAETNANETARSTILSGADTLNGAGGRDRMYGYAGDDTITGGGGEDFLRGNEGNDSLFGGDAFDDLHGNMGDDVVSGGNGGDWVVGGQGNDTLYGGDDASDDVVYGNLGHDTQLSGDGNDWIRGGQGNDSLDAGGGADLVWGDRGDDTITGGAGADTFSIFGEAGSDRILDFNPAEGDRLRVEPGYTYTVAQVGADVVVSISGGAQAVLVGKTVAALGEGWVI